MTDIATLNHVSTTLTNKTWLHHLCLTQSINVMDRSSMFEFAFINIIVANVESQSPTKLPMTTPVAISPTSPLVIAAPTKSKTLSLVTAPLCYYLQQFCLCQLALLCHFPYLWLNPPLLQAMHGHARVLLFIYFILFFVLFVLFMLFWVTKVSCIFNFWDTNRDEKISFN